MRLGPWLFMLGCAGLPRVEGAAPSQVAAPAVGPPTSPSPTSPSPTSPSPPSPSPPSGGHGVAPAAHVPAAATAAAGDPGTTCGGPARRWSYAEGSQAFARVAPGWTKARVTAALGAPSVCDRDVWTYVGGPYTGPEVRYRLTFVRGVVAAIERTSVGCRVVE